ncbi:hypothetical protein SPHINGOAX6_70007 [Sphingomonas sp. AX6]|nr:hypothetical protein SPHINGOAX6_70007 [Sphingomonas sp. AX6]
MDSLLALEPRAIRGHIMKGDCRNDAGDKSAALGLYKSALRIAAGQNLPNELAAELRRVDTASTELAAHFEAQREIALNAQGLDRGNRSSRFQRSLNILSGREQIFVQEPTAYYYPELPQIPYFDPTSFRWAAQVEAAANEIRKEIQVLLNKGTDDFLPYIRSDPNLPRLDDNILLDNRDWSALFLCENGRRFEDTIARCPNTWNAVQNAPLPIIANSPTVMFSLLRAGAHITPHTGTHNTRLTCHLPLIVPPDCFFRVGSEVRQWQEGKLLIFDDTIEHEAWNNSDRDRVVLIFDIWRPELSEQDKQEIGALFASEQISIEITK